MECISEIVLDGLTEESAPVLDLSEVGFYRFFSGGLKIDAFISIRPASDAILFCGHSAITPKFRNSLPAFHRHSWAPDIEASFVTFHDPTLYVYPELLGGWSQGSVSVHAVPEMYKVVKLIQKSVSKHKRSVFYGSSAGGFWAMMTAALDKSVCMVEIPQTDMFTCPLATARELLLEACYKEQGLDPYHFRHRLSVVDWFKYIESMPKAIYYFQNIKDEAHTEAQLRSFEADMKALAYKDLSVAFYEREDKDIGHVVMHKSTSVAALNRLLLGASL